MMAKSSSASANRGEPVGAPGAVSATATATTTTSSGVLSSTLLRRASVASAGSKGPVPAHAQQGAPGGSAQGVRAPGRASSLHSAPPGGASSAPAKPRARDLHRFLAAAVQMAGEEVEEGVVPPRKDNDDVPTRDKIKRSTKVFARQMAVAAANSAAAAAAAGVAPPTSSTPPPGL